MVGTNNLKSDGTNTILKKYEELIRTAKEKCIRNVTVVGIVCRNDVGEYHEFKRYAINAKLKKKCEMMGVYYVEMDVMYKDRNRVLCRDGLHLNDRGRTRWVGRFIIIFFSSEARGGAEKVGMGNRSSKHKGSKLNKNKFKPQKQNNIKNNKERQNQISCFYCNTRSVINKIRIRTICSGGNSRSFCITESWANANIGDGEININGYTVFRKDRTNRIGGGVLLYVKNNNKAIHRTDLDNDECEMVWCELLNNKEKTLVGVCYRSPNSSVDEDRALFRMLGNVKDSKAMIVGEFNFGDINWERQEATGQSKEFLDSVNDNFLYQRRNEETGGRKILDLVLSSEENIVVGLEVGEPFGTSDHRVIRWTLAVGKDMDRKKKVFWSRLRQNQREC